MPAQDIDARAQAAVVLEALQRPKGVQLTALVRTIKDVDVTGVEAAADSLCDVGVLRRDGDRYFSTPALDRMDAIGMVCV